MAWYRWSQSPAGIGSMSMIQARWPGTPVVNRQVPYPPGGPGPARVKVNPVLAVPGGSVPPGGPRLRRRVRGSGRAQACADGPAPGVGDGQAPRRLRVGRGGSGQVAGLPRVHRPQPVQFPGPVGQAEQGGQRGGEVVPPANPAGIPPPCPPGTGPVAEPGTRYGPAGCPPASPGAVPRDAAGRESWSSSKSMRARARSRSMPPSRPAARSSRAHQVMRWSMARTCAGGSSRPASAGVPGIFGPSFHPRVPGGVLAPVLAFRGATWATARAITWRSAPGLKVLARPRTSASAWRASSGSSSTVWRAMICTLEWRRRPSRNRPGCRAA